MDDWVTPIIDVVVGTSLALKWIGMDDWGEGGD